MPANPTILCLGPTPAMQRVMVFGKLTIDEVNRAVETHDCPAGKSVNVARVLATLGARPVALGFLGGDRGAWMVSELERLGIEQDFIDGPRTRQCTTVIDLANHTHTELVEESAPVEDEKYAQLL